MNSILYSRFFILIILVVVSGAMMSTPLQIVSLNLNIVILLLCFLLFGQLLFFKPFQRRNLNESIPVKYLILLCFLPLTAALMANTVFKQDFFSGFVSNVSFYNFLVLVYIYNYFRQKKIALKNIEKIVVTFGWMSAFFFYAVRILKPDLEFTVPSYEGNTVYTYTAYSLGSPFIPWLGMVYLAKYKEQPKLKFILFFLFLFGYIIIFQNARSFTLGLVFILLFFIRNELSIRSKFKFSLNAVFLIISIFFLANSIPQINVFFSQKLVSFFDAVNATQGTAVEEVSANSRIFQTDLALKYIKENLWLGVGVLKVSTKDKYISGYFFPSDVGVLGLIFNYGVLGFLILCYQLKSFYRAFINRSLKNNSFLLGTAYFILLRFVLSIFSGEFVYGIGFTFLLLSIIFFGSKKMEADKVF